MITKITGVLNRVLDEEVRLQVGNLEYQVLVAQSLRRKVQVMIGQEAGLITINIAEADSPFREKTRLSLG